MPALWSLTIDCARAAELATFWATALSYVPAPPPVGFASWPAYYAACDVPEEEWADGAALVDPTGVLPGLSFLKVPEGKEVKNRLHLDLRVSGGRHQPAELRTERIETEAARLTAIGATEVARHVLRDHLDHIVLADPEGNEFCVV